MLLLLACCGVGAYSLTSLGEKINDAIATPSNGTWSPDGTIATPANAGRDGGLAVGSGPVRVEIYLDYACPPCQTFETGVGDPLDQYLAAKRIALVLHPVAFLDRQSGNTYSTRAGAAAACASDGAKLRAYQRVLFTNQPKEGTPGPTDAQLIELGRSVGLGDPFATCVSSGTYLSWVKAQSAAATSAGISGVPTVLVAGSTVAATKAAVTAAIDGAR